MDELVKIAQPKLCPVGYVNNCNTTLNCGYETCSEGLKNWLLQNIVYNTVNEDDEDEKAASKCMNCLCEHKIFKKEAQAKLNSMEFEIINERYLFFYLANQKDVARCPTDGCGYAGVMVKTSCRNDLICDKCNMHWRESSQNSFFGSELFTLDFGQNGKFSSYFKKAVFTKLCPGCGICIEKISGCAYVYCSFCRNEFGWICLEVTNGHSHKSNLVLDPIIMLFYWPTILFFLISVLLHLGYIYPVVLRIISMFFYYLVVTLFSIMSSGLGFAQFAFWSDELKRYERNLIVRLFSIAHLLLFILFVWAAVSNSGFWRDSLIGHGIILCLAIIGITIKCIVDCRKPKPDPLMQHGYAEYQDHLYYQPLEIDDQNGYMEKGFHTYSEEPLLHRNLLDEEYNYRSDNIPLQTDRLD